MTWTDIQIAYDQCVRFGGIEPTVLHVSPKRMDWIIEEFSTPSGGFVKSTTYRGLRFIARFEDAIPGDRILSVP